MRTEGRQHGARSLLTAERVDEHEYSGAIPPTQLVDRSYSAYSGLRRAFSGIPPTQLVDCSYSAYNEAAARLFWNPTNAVGGLFIRGLQSQPQSVLGLSVNDPPTALVVFRNTVPQASP